MSCSVSLMRVRCERRAVHAVCSGPYMFTYETYDIQHACMPYPVGTARQLQGLTITWELVAQQGVVWRLFLCHMLLSQADFESRCRHVPSVYACTHLVVGRIGQFPYSRVHAHTQHLVKALGMHTPSILLRREACTHPASC